MSLVYLFPINSIVCPNGRIPLQIFEPRYLDMVAECMKSGNGFVILLMKEGRDTDQQAEFYATGTFVRIIDFYTLPNGLLGVTCEGVNKVRVLRHQLTSSGLHAGELEALESEPFIETPKSELDLVGLLQRLMQYPAVKSLEMDVNYTDSREVGWRLTELLPISPLHKQTLLEMENPAERLSEIQSLLAGLE